MFVDCYVINAYFEYIYQSEVMNRRTKLSNSFFIDIFSDTNTKWKSFALKRQSADAKRDPKGNFLALNFHEMNDTDYMVEKLKTEASCQDRIPSSRLEIFISNISGPEEVRFCKKGHETLASAYFCSGLLGVMADENQELQNLTANNSVFIFKCRKNHFQYKPYVNCDELFVNIRGLLEDFERIEVVAGSSYVIEPSAIYFWYSMSYCHVIIHRMRDQHAARRLHTSADEAGPSNSEKSPLKSSVINEINNGLAAESKCAKKLRLNSVLRDDVLSRSSTSSVDGNRSMYIVDEEIHVMCETVDLTGEEGVQRLPSLQLQCSSLQDEVKRQEIASKQKDEEIKQLKTEINSQKKEIENIKSTLVDKDSTLSKMRADIKSLKKEITAQNKVIDSQKKIIEGVRNLVNGKKLI